MYPAPLLSAGLIVYAGNDGNIYVIDRDGNQKGAVTQDATLTPGAGEIPRIYQYPTWAPDGRHLAYMSFSRPESSGIEASLFTSLPDGSERIQAFSSQDAAPFYLFWSPDSQTISFLSNQPGGAEILLNLAPAAGGENKIIGSGQPYYWDWSPDNRTLIIHTGGSIAENPNARLALVDLESPSQIRELDLKPGFFQAPAWSPAGDDLALILQNEFWRGRAGPGRPGWQSQAGAGPVERASGVCLGARGQPAGLFQPGPNFKRTGRPPGCSRSGPARPPGRSGCGRCGGIFLVAG